MSWYLNFIHGMVESEDLPLNIFWERLQQNKILKKVIFKNIVEKVPWSFLSWLKTKRPQEILWVLQEFKAFNSWRPLSVPIWAPLMSGDEVTSLSEYVSQVKEEQKTIYCITGENKEQVANSAFVECVQKWGFDVVCMTEPTDEYCV